MCKMRIVILDSNKNIENDFVADLGNINLNIVDRPAFCIYSKCNDNGYDNLIFKLSNIEELQTTTESVNNWMAVYGKVSGCLYSISFKSILRLSQNIKLLYRSIHVTDNIRFNANIYNYFKLAEKIIMIVNSNSFV